MIQDLVLDELAFACVVLRDACYVSSAHAHVNSFDPACCNNDMSKDGLDQFITSSHILLKISLKVLLSTLFARRQP